MSSPPPAFDDSFNGSFLIHAHAETPAPIQFAGFKQGLSLPKNPNLPSHVLAPTPLHQPNEAPTTPLPIVPKFCLLQPLQPILSRPQLSQPQFEPTSLNEPPTPATQPWNGPRINTCPITLEVPAEDINAPIKVTHQDDTMLHLDDFYVQDGVPILKRRVSVSLSNQGDRDRDGEDLSNKFDSDLAHYNLVRALGTGAFGSVDLLQHKKSNHLVACKKSKLKCVDENQTIAHTNLIECAMNEMTALNTIRNNGIDAYLLLAHEATADAVSFPGYYMVTIWMEVMSRGSLRGFIERYTPSSTHISATPADIFNFFTNPLQKPTIPTAKYEIRPHENFISEYDDRLTSLHAYYMNNTNRYTSLEVVSHVGHAILSGLRDLYRCSSDSLIHRDIKPENVLINDQYQIKLGDFGLAKSADEFMGPGTQADFGTEHFLSPERKNLGYPTSAGDIWALGITLLQLCGIFIEKQTYLNLLFPLNNKQEHEKRDILIKELVINHLKEHYNHAGNRRLDLLQNFLTACLRSDHSSDERADFESLLDHPFLKIVPHDSSDQKVYKWPLGYYNEEVREVIIKQCNKPEFLAMNINNNNDAHSPLIASPQTPNHQFAANQIRAQQNAFSPAQQRKAYDLVRAATVDTQNAQLHAVFQKSANIRQVSNDTKDKNNNTNSVQLGDLQLNDQYLIGTRNNIGGDDNNNIMEIMVINSQTSSAPCTPTNKRRKPPSLSSVTDHPTPSKYGNVDVAILHQNNTKK